MKDYNQEYFYMYAKGVNFPRLSFTGSQPIKDSQLFYSEERIDNDHIIPLMFASPILPKPQLADVHHIGSTLAISEKLKSHLEQLRLKNVQFIPASIQDYSDDIYNNFYIIHIYNLVRCADLEKSEWRPVRRDPSRVLSFDKLILDNELLDKIPLEDRLVIALEEQNLDKIYHRSIVDHILKLWPTGVTFYPLAGFTGNEPFEDEFLEYIKSE